MSNKRKASFLLAILAVCLLVTTGFEGLNNTTKVVVDGNVLFVENYFNENKNVSDIVNRAGVQMGPHDEYRVSKEGLWRETVVNVYRAVPVKIYIGGTTKEVFTAKQNIGELMNSMGFVDVDAFKVNLPKDTKIYANMEVKVVQVKKERISKKEEISAPVLNQPDSTMEKGEVVIKRNGENGIKEICIENTYEDGVLLNSKVVSEKVEKKPTEQINLVGTREVVETSRGIVRFREVHEMEATAYLPTDGNGEGITATGMVAQHGVVAIDPNMISLGSRLYIPGYGFAVAADTGGAIKGERVDLCMENYDEAMDFGRQNIKVYILD